MEFTSLVDLPDSGRLAVHRFVTNRPVLLLLHANGFPASTYRQLIRALLQFYEIYAVDLRGQGDAERGAPEVELTVAQHVRDITHVVHYFKLRGCHAFGHSLGGGVLIKAEENSPGLFHSLAVYEPVMSTLEARNGNLDVLSQMALKRQRRFRSRPAAIESYRRKMPFSAFSPEALRDFVQHGFRLSNAGGEIELKTSPENESETYHGCSEMGLHRPENVRCPILLIMGARNDGDHKQLKKIYQQYLTKILPSLNSITIEGIGHFGPFEDPKFVAESVLQFFQKNAQPLAKL